MIKTFWCCIRSRYWIFVFVLWKVYQQNTKYDCGIRNRQPLSRYTATALHSYIIINYTNPRTSYRLSLSNQIWMSNAYCLGSSTCPLDFGCCKLSHEIFLKLRKKELPAKVCKFTNTTAIFTQKDNRGPFWAKIVVILRICSPFFQAVLFS